MLVAGGFIGDRDTAIDKAELYDPTTLRAQVMETVAEQRQPAVAALDAGGGPHEERGTVGGDALDLPTGLGGQVGV